MLICSMLLLPKLQNVIIFGLLSELLQDAYADVFGLI